MTQTTQVNLKSVADVTSPKIDRRLRRALRRAGLVAKQKDDPAAVLQSYYERVLERAILLGWISA